jgi:glutathione synthase/RimK-type ligase-like ATP-grasp enzyme
MQRNAERVGFMSQQRILFISRYDERESYDTAFSMAAALKTSDIHYDACFLQDLIFDYDGTDLRVLEKSGLDIDSYDGIFLLGWFKLKMYEDAAVTIARYAAHKNIPLLNSEAAKTRSYSKLSQCVIAALNGVSVTPFVFCMDGQRLLDGVHQSHLTYPLIVKGVLASRGGHNHLVHSEQELQQIITDYPEVPFIAQTYVPNDGDYRLLVMGNQVTMAIHRQSQTDSHLNNTSQGGAATLVPVDSLPQQMLSDALTMSQSINRELTGVDMIVHRQTGHYYFLEANNMPQLSTGSFVEQKMQHLDQFLRAWLQENKRND